MKFGAWKSRDFLMGSLAILCFVLLFVGGPGPGPYSLRTFSYAWGLGHLFSFALWTVLYLGWRRNQLPIWRRFGEALLLAFLLGGSTEIIQLGIAGREATWPDFGLDLLGCILALVFAGELRQLVAGWRIWLLRLPVLLVVGWILSPLVMFAADDLLARYQFPLLSGFEHSLELGRWGGNCYRYLDSQHVYSGSKSLRVELNTHRYSGIALKYFPADWSEYRAVRFQIYNPLPDPLTLYFRIHDQLHRQHENRYSDRFNTRLVALSGWTEQEISLAEVEAAPKGRKMDLSKIAGMVIFVGKLEKPRTFYLDDVRLVR